MSYDPGVSATIDRRIAETAAAIQKDIDTRETSLRLAIYAVDDASISRLEAAFSTVSAEIARKVDTVQLVLIQRELEAKIDAKADRPPAAPVTVEI